MREIFPAPGKMAPCPPHVEDEFRRLWYGGQITLRANGGEDAQKIAALKANYDLSERWGNHEQA